MLRRISSKTWRSNSGLSNKAIQNSSVVPLDDETSPAVSPAVSPAASPRKSKLFEKIARSATTHFQEKDLAAEIKVLQTQLLQTVHVELDHVFQQLAGEVESCAIENGEGHNNLDGKTESKSQRGCQRFSACVQNRLTSLDSQVDGANVRVQHFEDDLEDLSASIKALEELTTAACNELRERAAAFDADLENTNAAVLLTSKHLEEDIQTQLSELVTEFKDANADREDLRMRVNAVDADSGVVRSRMNAAEAHLGKLDGAYRSRMDDLLSRIDATDAHLDDAQLRLQQAHAGHEILCSRIQTIESGLESLVAKMQENSECLMAETQQNLTSLKTETQHLLDLAVKELREDLQVVEKDVRSDHDAVCARSACLENLMLRTQYNLENLATTTQEKLDASAIVLKGALKSVANHAQLNHDSQCTRADTIELRLESLTTATQQGLKSLATAAQQSLDSTADTLKVDLQTVANEARSHHDTVCSRAQGIELRLESLTTETQQGLKSLATTAQQGLASTKDKLKVDLDAVANEARSHHDTVCSRAQAIELRLESLTTKTKNGLKDLATHTQQSLDSTADKLKVDLQAAADEARSHHDTVCCRAQAIEVRLESLATTTQKSLDSTADTLKGDLQAVANEARSHHDTVCSRAQAIELSLEHLKAENQNLLDSTAHALRVDLETATNATRADHDALRATMELRLECLKAETLQKFETISENSATMTAVQTLGEMTKADNDALRARIDQTDFGIRQVAATFSQNLATTVQRCENSLKSFEVLAKADHAKISAEMDCSSRRVKDTKADISKLDEKVASRLEDFARSLDLKADIGTLYLQGREAEVKQLDADWNYCMDWDVSGIEFCRYKYLQSMDSAEFSLGCLHGVRLRFQPCWDAQGKTCLLALVVPKGTEICCRISVDNCVKEARLLAHAEEACSFFGSVFPASKGSKYRSFHLELMNGRLAAAKTRSARRHQLVSESKA